MNTKPRRPWVAVIFTIIETGLGHMYAGSLKRGIILFGVGALLVLMCSAAFTLIVPGRLFMVSVVGIGLAYAVYCIVDAASIAKSKRTDYQPAKYNRWYAYIGYIVAAQLLAGIIIFVIVGPYFVQAFKLPTGSMEPTIFVGDHILTNKLIYRFAEPKRGDLILFKYPKDPQVMYFKRVIGLPGERIEVKGRTVFVDGECLVERYVQYLNPGSIHDHYGPVYVPKKGDGIEVLSSSVMVNGQSLNAEILESYADKIAVNNGFIQVSKDQFIVMGDNRDNSMDSRYWGSVPRDYVLGKASVIYWSFETPRDEYLKTGILDRIKRLTDGFINFFSKTRWERIFQPIQ